MIEFTGTGCRWWLDDCRPVREGIHTSPDGTQTPAIIYSCYEGVETVEPYETSTTND